MPILMSKNHVVNYFFLGGGTSAYKSSGLLTAFFYISIS